jgi:hypothetical protein
MCLINITTITVRDFLTYFQVVTAIISSIYYYKYKSTFLKYFSFLLWYISLNEFIGKYYTIYTGNHNQVFYNIKQVVEITFYLLLFSKYMNIKNSVLITRLLLLYVLFFLIYCIWHSLLNEYFAIPYLIGISFIVVAIILYFIEILRSDEIIFINNKLLFWIGMGLLIYYVPTIPFKVVTFYYQNSPTVPYIYNISYLLVLILNLIFISGFIWSKKEQ